MHPKLVRKGGLETRLQNYIHFFSRRGDEVTVITNKVDPTIPLPEGVRVIAFDFSRVPKPLRIWFFARRVREVLAREHFDFELSLGRTAPQQAILAPNTHLGFMRAMGRPIKGPLDYLRHGLEKQSFKGSLVIYAASQEIVRELEEFYDVDMRKVVVAYPPLNLERFGPELKARKAELREKYGLSPDRTSFLFVSTSHKIKNYALLRRVFRRLEDLPVELIVAGRPIKKGGRNIRYVGYAQQVEELFAAADFTIHPSRYEAFGQVIAESLQSLTPVLISRNVAAKELLREGEGVVVQDFRASTWERAVRDALDTSFHVEPGFAERHQISLEHHMQVLLDNHPATAD